MTWRFTCDDGKGGVTVSIPWGWYASAPVLNVDWHIRGGSGSYADLRGKGSLQGQRLSSSFADP